MRKNFLLLFLLTLLPLAGWAENYSVHVNAKAISIMYGVANPGQLAVSNDMFTATNVATGASVSDAAKTKIAAKLKFSTTRNADSPVAGNYTFTLSLRNTLDDTTEAVDGNTYTIVLQVVNNELVVTKSNDVEVTTDPTQVGEALFYDNTDQTLLATPGSGRTGEVVNLPLEYSFNGADGWVDEIKAKNAGNYTIYYRVKETANYEASAVSANPLAISIGKGTPTINVAPTTVENWTTYDGLSHQLLTAPATADFGTVKYQYSYKAPGEAEYGGWNTKRTNYQHADFNVKNAGTYRIQYFIEEDDNCNAVAVQRLYVTVSKATLKPSIKAGQSKEYGDADPVAFEAEYDGFQNGETAATAAGFIAPTMARVAGENGGIYAITMNENGAATNYTFDYSDANQVNFSITAKPLSDAAPFEWTLADASKPYTGSAITNSFSKATYNSTALGGETNLVKDADYTITYQNNVNAGTAKMIVSGKGNFKGSIEKTFTISQAGILIIPQVATKVYRDAEPGFTYKVKIGTAPAINNNGHLHGTVKLARVAGENVGTYKIYVESYTADAENPDDYDVTNDLINAVNYRPATELADFTITASTTPVVLEFTDDAKQNKASKAYDGTTDVVFSINDLQPVSGLKDAWDDIKTSLGTPEFTLASAEFKDNATNQVTVTGLVSSAYPNISVTPMAFTIEKREIEVTLADQTIAYGDALGQVYGTNWNITDGTLATGEGAAVLGLTVETVNPQATYAVQDDAYVDAIKATIENTNYNLTVVNGDLTVQSGGAITLNRAGDMDALIKAYDGKNIAVTLDRNITRTEAWFAMVLPFETTVTELSSKYGYAVVNVLDEGNTDASKVKFKLHMQTIAANQPFLIKIATAKESTMDFGSKPIVYAADPMSKDVAGNEFHGVFKETELAASDYLWTMVPAQNSFKKLDQSGTTLTPINAYLKTKDNLDAFAPTIFVEDFDFNSNTTAIKALNLENMKAYNVDGWYNLNGVKLQGVPTEKGIYINNGKKVVIK